MRNFWLMLQSFLSNPNRQQAIYAAQLLSVILSGLNFTLHHNNQDKATGNNYVGDALNYIHHHLNHRLYIDDIAKELNISRSYLTRIFKVSQHISVNQYIQQAKIH